MRLAEVAGLTPEEFRRLIQVNSTGQTEAETGRCLGASYQTGWTACIADLLQR